jgi:hypothetical protein
MTCHPASSRPFGWWLSQGFINETEALLYLATYTEAFLSSACTTIIANVTTVLIMLLTYQRHRLTPLRWWLSQGFTTARTCFINRALTVILYLAKYLQSMVYYKDHFLTLRHSVHKLEVETLGFTINRRR